MQCSKLANIHIRSQSSREMTCGGKQWITVMSSEMQHERDSSPLVAVTVLWTSESVWEPSPHLAGRLFVAFWSVKANVMAMSCFVHGAKIRDQEKESKDSIPKKEVRNHEGKFQHEKLFLPSTHTPGYSPPAAHPYCSFGPTANRHTSWTRTTSEDAWNQ